MRTIEKIANYRQALRAYVKRLEDKRTNPMLEIGQCPLPEHYGLGPLERVVTERVQREELGTK